MKNALKLILLLAVTFAVSVMLLSCKSGDKDDPPAHTVDDDVIYSPYVKTTLVLGEDISEHDVMQIRTAYYKIAGKEIDISSAASPNSHEIVVGKTDRYVSEKAYRILTLIEKEEYVGFTIYSDGKSVGIAFDEAVFGETIALSEAVDYFVEKYMKSESLKFNAGAVYYTTFLPIDKQKERDEESINNLWALKESQLFAKIESEEKADAVLAELKSLYNIFNNNYSIVTWLANLYDPGTGGFYYSNSARNNEGYSADLESTSQALGIVEAILTGYGGTLTNYFGEEIAEKFVSFANDMQASNGYFYHPQWKREDIDKNPERRARDVLAALNILESFNAPPIYDINGVAGSGAVSPVSKLTLPVGTSKAIAVAQLISSDDEIYIPSYLRSKEEFESYLLSLDICSNTTAACETLNSEFALYEAVDKILEENGEKYRLKDILANYLAQTQNKDTGLWCQSGTVDRNEVGELSEIIRLYNKLEKSVPRYSSILQSIESCLGFDKELDSITDISKVWLAFSDVVINLTSYCDKSTQSNIKYQLSKLYPKFDTFLKTTREQLVVFLKNDGSFSTTVEGSASEQLGMPVAVPLTEEGDMNATLIATKNIYLSLFNVLGLGSVPIFSTSDRMMFQKTLLDLGIVIKNEIKPTEPLDFENESLGIYSEIKALGSGATGYTEVVKGPEKYGQVLQINSPNGSTDYFDFKVMSDVRNGTCFSYEFDLCFASVDTEGIFGRLNIRPDAHLFNLSLEGDTVSFIERSAVPSDVAYTYDHGMRVKIGEWCKLRVEYYPGTADTVRIKIYLNDTCIAVTDNFSYDGNRENGAPVINCDSLRMYLLKGAGSVVLVDNIIIESTYKTYAPETSRDISYNVDTPDKSQKMNDFESQAVGTKPSGFTSSGSGITVTTDKTNSENKVLSITNTAGTVLLPVDQRGSYKNSIVIEFDFTADTASAVGAAYTLSFHEHLYWERTFAEIGLVVVEEGGEKYVTLAEAASGKTGAVYSGIKLMLGTKYRLRFHLFIEEETIAFGYGKAGEEIKTSAVDANVTANLKFFRIGDVKLNSIASQATSTIYIDNFVCESVKSNFEEITKPDVDRETASLNTSENKKITVQVNNRVDIPAIAFIGFDVTQSDINGALTIYLTDKSGKEISAFMLRRSSSGVEIYEYTANGKYSVPMHTVSDFAFKFEMEYSPEKKCYNILVNGEYVAASSFEYTEDSAENKFEQLVIETSASGWILDNIYAEQMYGAFKGHGVSMPNTDNEITNTMTFETSSFASMPSSIEIHIGTSGSHALIREGNTGEAVSKVLELTAIKAAGANALVFKNLNKDASKNSVFFETDMMMQATDGLANLIMSFRSLPDLAYNFTLQSNEPGGNITALGADGQDFTKILDIKDGEWFKLRLEYRDTPYDFDYDGKNDCLFRFYINDVLLGEGHTPRTVGNLQTTESIYAIRITAEWRTAGKYHFDNVTFGQCDMTYDAPIEPDTDTITNNPGVIQPTKTTFIFGKTTSTAEISDMTVGGEVNNVLKFHSASASLDKMYVMTTLTNPDANAVMFETDIMINPTSNSDTLYLEPLTASGKQPFRLTLKATKGGNVTVFAPGITETEIGKSGEWIHLKVEYMNPKADYDGNKIYDILYKIYVGEGENETLLKTGYKPYSASSYYEPTDLEKFAFTVTAESEADIYVDNTRFWQVERIPDEAPEFDYTEDGPIDGSYGYDGDGWA